MKNMGRLLSMIPGVGATILIGSEVMHVAFIADVHTLSEYSWGSGAGWAYQSKYHYLASGLLWIIVAWVPFVSWLHRQRINKRSLEKN